MSCDPKTFEITPAARHYGTDWFERGSQRGESDAIIKLLHQMVAGDLCDGGCKKDDERCLPIGVEIEIPKGKGKFDKVKDPDKDSKLETYLLKVKEGTKIKITTDCKCLKVNMD